MEFTPHFGFAPLMFVGAFLSLLFWVALIGFGVWAVRRFTDSPNRPSPNQPAGGAGSNAFAILQERLAKGEIDTDEYDRIKRTLNT